MRTFRLAAAVAGLIASGLVLTTAMPASASSTPANGFANGPANGQTLTLPAPNGRYATGESTFRLVDDHRADPWVPSRPSSQFTIDHTGEAPATEFPDGRVVGNGPAMALGGQAVQDGTLPRFLRKLTDVRVADTKLVLDRLPALPGRLTRGMDLNRIGMFGQSGGGFTAASTMYTDPRIKAGIDMDGTMEYTSEPDGTHLSQVALHGLNRPFLLMGSSGHDASDIHSEASWASFWQHQSAWKADVTLNDSEHASFTDAEVLLPQLAGMVPAATLTAAIGTGDPRRAIAADRALVDSFFDLFLKGCDNHLLDGRGASQYPITFVR